MVRDARVFTIGGGTAQILRTVVARGCSAAGRNPTTGIISWTGPDQASSRGDWLLALQQHSVKIAVFAHVVVGGRLVQ